MQYFCELHDDYYFNAVKFTYAECPKCQKIHELDYKLACKKCEGSRKINYDNLSGEIEEFERQLKSNAEVFNKCIDLAQQHFQDENTFFAQASLNMKKNRNQIHSLVIQLVRLKKRIKFILRLMEIPGPDMHPDEMEQFRVFENLIGRPHYIDTLSITLDEISICACGYSRLNNQIKTFIEQFQKNSYIEDIYSAKNPNILYTLSHPAKLYIGARDEKVREGQGIETYDSDTESGSSEGLWENDQLIEGIMIIRKKCNYEYYYKGKWNKDKQFYEGVKIITDFLLNSITKYKGQWENGNFDGQKSVKDAHNVIKEKGTWEQDKFWNGTKEIITKLNNYRVQKKYKEGQEEQSAVVQNPESEWIFQGILKDDKKYQNGILYHRNTKNNYYQGTFQDQNKKLKGQEYVDKQLRYDGTYRNDKYHGTGILFQNNGTAYYKGQFVNGEMHGLVQKMRASVNYKISANDIPLGQIQFYFKGAPEELCPLF